MPRSEPNDPTDPRVQRMPALRVLRGDTAAPFPTRWWLADAALDRAVADLERRGGVARYEAMIQHDPALRAALHADHARYAAERWASLSDAERAWCAARGCDAVLRDTGVAGVANFDAVKCLHAHVAHALGDDNVIGRRVLAELGIR